MPLKIAVNKKEEGVFVVSPDGSIDTETTESFEAKIKEVLDKGAKAIILDMKKVGYISSIGLSAIFKTKKAIETKGGKLVIADLKPQIKKVFDLVKAIPDCIFESMTQADEYLDAFLARIQEDKRDNK
ncbi:MAG: anti-sigma factor antagonist [Candidatus Omnitrophica bacterium CG07_land_8_20_14_0_80_42_15]|uniref:Anti-sigma factor antagonist n=1 Tax=Candidatus Aquitaenariimonas noxiae TaxID=1974741 RepID=A0A2J0KTS9_9BACT|nr:MAG: anti-sigma factor antagonist [Candidatus Omnitrophica bacterium CG07_land_8_20_14_0_80_42_15]